MSRSIAPSQKNAEHPSSSELIEFINGRLDANRSLLIESHLEDCDDCCQSLGALDSEGAINKAFQSAATGKLFGRSNDSVNSGFDLSHSSQDNRYVTLKEIDRGGMGVVVLVHDRHLDREVAMKTLRPDADSLEVRNRFAKEARIGARLNHPGIAPIHELGAFDDGRPFMAMKLVRGETLSARIEKQESLPSLLSKFVKLCECISYAHSQNVIHRDLKPQNIMVGEFGEVQVMDWAWQGSI